MSCCTRWPARLWENWIFFKMISLYIKIVLLHRMTYGLIMLQDGLIILGDLLSCEKFITFSRWFHCIKRPTHQLKNWRFFKMVWNTDMETTGCSLMLDMNDMSLKISVLTLNHLTYHLATIHFFSAFKTKKKKPSQVHGFQPMVKHHLPTKTH